MKTKLPIFGALVASTLLGFVASCTYHETETAGTTTTTTYTPGHVVTTLPGGYRTVTIRGTRYYTYGDTYYQPHSSGYVVVNSPYTTSGVGVNVIRELPSGYRVVTHGGTRYYRAGDVYYQQRSGGYVVVDSPF